MISPLAAAPPGSFRAGEEGVVPCVLMCGTFFLLDKDCSERYIGHNLDVNVLLCREGSTGIEGEGGLEACR